MQKSRPLWEGGGSGTACHLRTCLRLLGLGPVSATGPGMRPLGWAQGRRPASQAESTSTAEVEGGETERQGHMVFPLPLPAPAPLRSRPGQLSRCRNRETLVLQRLLLDKAPDS